MSMPRKPKIAIVNVFFPPQSIGGATRVVADNAEMLAQAYGDRFELVFFTSDSNGQPAHRMHVYSHEGQRVYRTGVLQRVHMDWHPADPEMGELFGEFLDFERPDLVHFHCIQRLTGSIVEATLERGIPYVVTVHDAWWISDHQFLVDPLGTVHPEGHPDPFAPLALPEGITLDESLGRRTHLKSLLNQAARVLVVSEAFARIYARNGIGRLSVNRNGIRPRQWLPREPSPSGRIRLAHVGGMAEHKGYPLLRRALAQSGYRHLEALVVDHAKPTGHESQAMWGSVPVTFIGKVPQARIEQLYARMDVLMAPSVWPESFGLVTREAAAAGVWVVASSLGGMGEDVEPERNGWVIEPTPAQLRAVCDRLEALASPQRLQPVSSRPVRTVRAQVEELVQVYEELLA